LTFLTALPGVSTLTLNVLRGASADLVSVPILVPFRKGCAAFEAILDAWIEGRARLILAGFCKGHRLEVLAGMAADHQACRTSVEGRQIRGQHSGIVAILKERYVMTATLSQKLVPRLLSRFGKLGVRIHDGKQPVATFPAAHADSLGACRTSDTVCQERLYPVRV
jgi:hypothetical protein